MKLAAHSCLLFTSLVCHAQTFRSNVDLVTIPCAVVDAQGVPVQGLTRDEFRVYDNGVRRPVQNLWFDTEEPMTLAIIIDASESQRGKRDEHTRTAAELQSRLIKPGDHAYVTTIGDEGSSALWDAVAGVATDRLRSLKGAKAILILTDGFDTGSRHSWRQAADEAHKSGAAVYAVQYVSSLGGSYAPDLYRLIDEAGGATFQPPKGDTSQIATRLENDLRRRYVLGFRPDQLSARVRHEVRVEVNRPELTVRARKTYFIQ